MVQFHGFLVLFVGAAWAHTAPKNAAIEIVVFGELPALTGVAACLAHGFPGEAVSAGVREPAFDSTRGPTHPEAGTFGCPVGIKGSLDYRRKIFGR